MPEDGCGEGFAADGAGSCTPVLPGEPCGPGALAVPGDTSCHPVAPCGEGDFSGIPVEDGMQYVLQGFSGESDGSPEKPWPTVQQGIDAATVKGAIIAIGPGHY